MNPQSTKVVLLHGWTPDTAVIERWQPLKKLFEKNNYQVYLWKIPGLTTNPNKTFTLEEYQVWLKTKIKPLKKVVLVGHSFGGQLATIFTEQNPELVEKLILINSAGIRDFTWQKILKRNMLKFLAKIGFIFKKINFFRKIIYKLIREKDYLEANHFQRVTINNALSFSVKPLLTNIKTPTLILWGENDQTTPLYLGKVFKNNLPHNDFIELPTRHSPVYTHPQLVFNHINQFIKEKKL
ncbi:MAG: alpha/beta fold hydrolase [Patescibacteria group bacterium]